MRVGSAIVRLGLPCRLVGTLVGAELGCLKLSEESLLANAGRPMAAGYVDYAAPAWLRVRFTRTLVLGRGCQECLLSSRRELAERGLKAYVHRRTGVAQDASGCRGRRSIRSTQERG